MLRSPIQKELTPGKRFRFRLESAAMLLVSLLVRCLPRAGARNLGRFLGGIAYLLAGKEKRIALANLDVAFGDTKTATEKRRIARAAFQNTVGTLVAMLWAQRLNSDNIHQYVELPPDILPMIEAAQSEGHGLILLTMHYGDWELLGLATALYGTRTTVVAKPLRNAALDRRWVALRSVTGNQIIPQDNATRALLKALRGGEAVALLTDLNARRDTGGVWVDFFGLPVFNNVAVAALAMHTGAPILFFVGEPMRRGRIRVAHHRRVPFQPTGDREEDGRRLSRQCLAIAEEVIRQKPDFWLWSYRRWHRRPTPEPGRYPFYSVYEPPRST